ncbi:MAG: MFS transporter [Verrucomicrobia bacterium]|nr:MFS transporter [Verrucomicrobiota bacterium]
MSAPSIGILFLTVFVDLIGFGIVLPLLPTYGESFGASGLTIGALMASYSAMQFLFSPIWGAWSDRVGRRPVLLVSTLGSTGSYALFAVASTLTGQAALWGILASRLLAGICGANLTVAQAYIADITPPADRSRRMGLIGMAFGLGFILGPALAIVAQTLFGKAGPGAVASVICGVNFLLAWARLPESWKPGTEPAARKPRLAQVRHVLELPWIGFLVVVFFLATFGFTCFETTLGILIARNFRLGEQASHNTNALLFCFAGLIGAVVQAGPVGRLVKRLGEPRLIALSLVVFAIGLAPVPWVRGHGTLSFATLFSAGAGPWWLLLGLVALIAVGSGLTRPPLFGLVSNLSPERERGSTLGVVQSAGSLARIAGPLFAGALLDQHPAWPYLGCATLALAAGLIAWHRLVGRVDLTERIPPSP